MCTCRSASVQSPNHEAKFSAKKCAVAAFVTLAAVLPVAAWCQPPALLAVWGSAGAQPGQFLGPVGLALDAGDNLYVTEANHRVQVLSDSGAFISQWGSYGTLASSITTPTGVALDESGRVFVAEWEISSAETQTGLQVFTTAGAYLANWGTYDQHGVPGDFSSPFGVAVSPDGHLYVTDTGFN